MAYTFESRATNSIVMLQSSGQHVLEIPEEDTGNAAGVIILQRIPAAIACLEAAVANEQRLALHPRPMDPGSEPVPPQRDDAVTLRQRVAPLVRMLERSLVEESDITWHT